MSEEEQIILPSGFKRVDYLQSSGTQWIQTDYCPSSETKIVSDFYFIKAGKNGRFCGNGAAYGGGTDKFTIFLSAYGTGAIIFDFGNVRKDKNNYNLSVGRHTISADKNGIVVDGTVALTTNNTNEFKSTNPMSIFAAGGETSQDGDYWRIYNFIIYENDTVVRYFIPCLNENDEPCMYDVINKKAYNNAGTGEFYYPRNYHSPNYNLPAGFKKCVYLQSDGTQWINTQVVPNTETGFYFRALQLSYDNFVPLGVEQNGYTIYPPRYNNKDLYYKWGNTSTKMMTWDKADDLIFSSYLNFYNSKFAYFDSSDTDVESYIASQTGTFTIPIWLFSYNVNGSYNATTGKWGGRIYRAQITQSAALIRDFVPCLDTDNRPCMYDLVSQEPYYNQSGGTEFTYCLEHELPSNFAKLKYLESDGTQFIKTGYVPTNNTGLYIDAYNTVVRTDWTQPFALRETNGNTYVSVGRVNKATNGAGFGWNAYTTPGGTGDCRYEATLNWLNDKKSIISAPAFAQRVNTLADLVFTPTIDLCLFGCHNYDGTYMTASYRIYRAKISEGSSIVRDYVPAYDEVKNKPCMYDLINNVAYYNDGTGEFVMPPKREGSYTGFAQLGGIGNRLGGGEIIRGVLPENPEGGGEESENYLVLYSNEMIYTGLEFQTSMGGVVDKVDIKFELLNFNEGSDRLIILGVEGDVGYELSCYNENYFNLYLGCNEQLVYCNLENDDEKIEHIIFELFGGEVYHNGKETLTDISFWFPHLTWEYPIQIGDGYGVGDLKIYEVIFYDENDNKISHMIPHEEDGQKGLYCTVRDEFYPVQMFDWN